jgi:hypothetical protein
MCWCGKKNISSTNKKYPAKLAPVNITHALDAASWSGQGVTELLLPNVREVDLGSRGAAGDACPQVGVLKELQR